MHSSENHARRAEPDPLVGNVVQDCIQIQHHQREALSVGIYQTPRVEDKPNINHQRVHDIDDSRSTVLPLYDARMASKWTTPSSIKDESLTLDFLVPVRSKVFQDLLLTPTLPAHTCGALSHCSFCNSASVLTERLEGTAVSLRVFDVASDSMYKYKVLAGDVNVARPKPIGVAQDYFVAPAQEWVYGTRFASDPCIVRQFQVLQGKPGLSLAAVLSKDYSFKCMEIEISSRKAYESTSTSDTWTDGSQSSESSQSHGVQWDLIDHTEAVRSGFQDAPGADGDEAATQDSVKEPQAGKVFSLPPWPSIGAHPAASPRRQSNNSPARKTFLRSFSRRYSGIETMYEQQHLMDICPGGLVRQRFSLDEDPGRWNLSCEGTLRIHLIDENQFESATGLERDASRGAELQTQRAFAVSDPVSRRFVQESEISSGLPSVAQLWEQMKPAKSRARVSPATTSTPRQVQLDIEEPETKQSVGKLAKCFFICGK